jgi:uncharacterized membrane protein
MLPENKTKTNIGVGIGVLLQLAGFFLVKTSETFAMTILGLILILISIPWFIWGCGNYAEGKGYSKLIGLVGLAGLIGLIVLIVLPDKAGEGSGHRLKMHKVGGLISLVLGFGIIVLGRWLDRLAYAALYNGEYRLERMLEPWSGRCMFLGACIVLVSLVLLLDNPRPNPESMHEGGRNPE